MARNNKQEPVPLSNRRLWIYGSVCGVGVAAAVLVFAVSGSEEPPPVEPGPPAVAVEGQVEASPGERPEGSRNKAPRQPRLDNRVPRPPTRGPATAPGREQPDRSGKRPPSGGRGNSTRPSKSQTPPTRALEPIS